LKKVYILLLIILFAGLLISCAPANRDILFQTTPFITLDRGYFDGSVTCGALKEHGDFGLGTFNSLDGEMVIIDGQIYQVKTDGIAYAVNDSALTPFAQITYFDPDISVNISNCSSFSELKEYLDSKLPTVNTTYAIRIKGTFPYVKTRSVPGFEKPYPTLTDAVKSQSEFELQNVTGTFVGFRAPAYVANINVPGYHFHFITEDRKAGGHVLDCKIDSASAEIDDTDYYFVETPESVYEADLNPETGSSSSKSE